MAKQASKAKSPGNRSRVEAKRSPKVSAAAPSAAKETKATGAASGRSKGAGTSKARAASAPKAAPSSSPRAKGAKLQAAGKAITSGHGAASKKKTTAAARPPAGTRVAREKPPAKAAGKKPRTVKRVAFDRKALASIRNSLNDQRQDLIDQLEDIEETAFSPSQTEASSEAGFDEDYADAGTATFEREKDLSIANNINSLVDKIDKALEKIEEGTYGICENCGQPISADRLKALPHVLLCINCKKAEERR